jgi:hypothetical protein
VVVFSGAHLLPDMANISRVQDEAEHHQKVSFTRGVIKALGCLHPSGSSTQLELPNVLGKAESRNDQEHSRVHSMQESPDNALLTMKTAKQDWVSSNAHHHHF